MSGDSPSMTKLYFTLLIAAAFGSTPQFVHPRQGPLAGSAN